MPTDVDATEGLVRIRIRLDQTDGEPGPAEDAVWAEPLGNDRYQIESCPFFAYGLSRGDVVRAAESAEQGGPVLEDVLEKGGHRTLRIALDPTVDLRSAPVQRILDRLIGLGCTHELLRPKIVAIDLPPEVDLAPTTEVLQEAARAGALVWEWADPRPS